MNELPLPPLEMRELVGPIEPAAFDNPTGALVYPEVDDVLYESVFDIGCGCGRVARQLMLQGRPPRRYVGIDPHRGMIEWCRGNLTPAAPQFEFLHHDVFNASFNPGDKPWILPFPAADASATFVNAHSVFTHLTQAQAHAYLHESSRILSAEGVLRSTWFLFDRADFPMLQEDMAALYVAYEDPSAAVIFDREWVRTTACEAGLVIFDVTPPSIRGFQWTIFMAPEARGLPEVELPPDRAEVGLARPPLMPQEANRIGLEGP
jgi:SAM-dependent methyltransferase